MAHGTLRALAAFCHFMVFASAVIVTGLVSAFLDRWAFRGYRVVYQEVIAVITLVIYMFAMFVPIMKTYRGYFAPVNFIFSYLWLASFIFSSQDWSGRLCSQTPLGTGRCAQKRTVEAFNFIAFFFLLINVIIEVVLFSESRDDSYITPPPVSKERPGTGGTDASATPAVQNPA
ncbi:might be a transmembrane protein [Purpureocillium lilacinum]|nr:might be a transmembrane protein [Purpureocillium lilacinum]OAQ79930.1 might be a transmembrane protein [Purpureocillium lilacinum]OAQ88667.1 might be a transmembrane protein [Purpureocillium lilacinum]GJN74194.1 hypothetical protein PLICBS_008284 [Purpureocillium lilacinum]GJN84712.1 hypothetical protein PLIIFM63780_008275 [Purpureocillium lilacinum]